MKTQRNYPLLLVSQFLGAFGDNMLLAIILGPLTFAVKEHKITEQQVNSANGFYSVLFFIPFVVLAPLAGYMNDRHPKTSWLLGGNLIKLAGAVLGALSVYFGHELMGAAYFIVGIGACCYSPAKYGILPEILPTDRLVKANGTVEMLTLTAILTGLYAGAWIIDHCSMLAAFGIVIANYLCSIGCNLFMERTPCNPDARLGRSVGEFFSNSRALLTHARLSRILMGSGLFWLVGATLRTNLQSWGLGILGNLGVLGDQANEQLARLKIWITVGIIVGSVAVGQFHRVGDLRGTRWYGWLMAMFILPLGFLTGTHGLWPIIGALLLSGIGAGLFLIPINAALQHESDHTHLGKTIATQNFVDYSAMLVGAGMVMGLSKAGMTASQIFIVLATVISILVAFLKIPELKENKTK